MAVDISHSMSKGRTVSAGALSLAMSGSCVLWFRALSLIKIGFAYIFWPKNDRSLKNVMSFCPSFCPFGLLIGYLGDFSMLV